MLERHVCGGLLYTIVVESMHIQHVADRLLSYMLPRGYLVHVCACVYVYHGTPVAADSALL